MKGENILSFVGGALLGFCAAMLLAPASGEETRKKIKESVEKEYDDIKERIKALQEKAEAAKEELKDATLPDAE